MTPRLDIKQNSFHAYSLPPESDMKCATNTSVEKIPGIAYAPKAYSGADFPATRSNIWVAPTLPIYPSKNITTLTSG